MSIENMSAENRNFISIQRCCSFCRRAGHRISNCDDERLKQFERLCYYNYANNNNNGIETLRQFLLDYSLQYPMVVRGYAHKKLGLNSRYNIDICIDRIIQYFTNNITTLQRINTSEDNISNNNILNNNSVVSALLYLSQSRTNRRQVELMELMLFMRTISQLGSFIDEFQNVNRKFRMETKLTEQNDINLTEVCECNICYESYEKKNFIKLNCSHEFCKECVKNCLKNEKRDRPSCAFCRNEINELEMHEEIIKEELADLII
jgi:hypothetical protein